MKVYNLIYSFDGEEEQIEKFNTKPSIDDLTVVLIREGVTYTPCAKVIAKRLIETGVNGSNSNDEIWYLKKEEHEL